MKVRSHFSRGHWSCSWHAYSSCAHAICPAGSLWDLTSCLQGLQGLPGVLWPMGNSNHRPQSMLAGKFVPEFSVVLNDWYQIFSHPISPVQIRTNQNPLCLPPSLPPSVPPCLPGSGSGSGCCLSWGDAPSAPLPWCAPACVLCLPACLPASLPPFLPYSLPASLPPPLPPSRPPSLPPSPPPSLPPSLPPSPPPSLHPSLPPSLPPSPPPLAPSLPPSLTPSLPPSLPPPGATPPRRASARRTEGPTPRAGSASRMRRVHRRHLSDGPPQEWLPHKTTQGRQLSVVWHPQRMPGCTTTTPPPKTRSRALPSGTLTGWRPQTPPKGAP